MFGGGEEMDLAGDGISVCVLEFSVAVAAADRLGKGVESCHCPVEDGEGEVDPGLDDGGGDEATGLLIFFALFDVSENGLAVGGGELGG